MLELDIGVCARKKECMGAGISGGGHLGPMRQGARPGGQARPPPSWTGGGPPDVDSSSSIFNIFQKYVSWSFRSFREL